MDKKTRPIYMLSTRNPTHNKKHAQIKSKGMEKYTQMEMKEKLA